jgi:hypothetical protein
MKRTINSQTGFSPVEKEKKNNIPNNTLNKFSVLSDFNFKFSQKEIGQSSGF